MSDVTMRLESVKAGVQRLRDQVPGTDWQQASALKLLAELAEIVGQLAAGGAAGIGPTSAVGKPAEDRRQMLERLAWMACRALPQGLDGSRRDAEICRILEGWNVSREELAGLGYAAEPSVETAKAGLARREKIS